MSDEKERAAQIDEDIRKADAKRRADAEAVGETNDKLERILAHLDSLGKRMDVYDGGRKDEEGEGEIEEKGKPKPLAADSMVVADAEEIENYKRESGSTHKVAADSVLAEIQRAADHAATAWGKSAPHPWDSEPITIYRRRTARIVRKYNNLGNLDRHNQTIEKLPRRPARCVEIYSVQWAQWGAFGTR